MSTTVLVTVLPSVAVTIVRLPCTEVAICTPEDVLAASTAALTLPPVAITPATALAAAVVLLTPLLTAVLTALDTTVLTFPPAVVAAATDVCSDDAITS